MTGRMACLALLAAVVLAGGAAQNAEAKYLAIFEEVGPDVVETGGWTLDLTNLKLTAAALSNASVSPDTAAYVSGVPGVFGYSFLGNITGPSDLLPTFIP
jgi:hypothetical protein